MGRTYEEKATYHLGELVMHMSWKEIAISLGKSIVYALLSISTGGR